MRNILQNSILFIFSVFLFSCHKDEETVYIGPPLYWYSWVGIDSCRLIVPFSALNQVFRLEDKDGDAGGIFGVTGVSVRCPMGDSIYDNTAVINGKNSIITDTLRGDWFTIINEHDKLRLSLEQNDGTKSRQLVMAFWAAGPLNDKSINGGPTCEQLVIIQQPLENR